MEDCLSLESGQHPDFIWTWKSNSRSAKVSLWLPYFSNVEKIPRTKTWHFTYNGGEFAIDLAKVDFIMFYGASGTLPLDFLDALSQHRIPLIVHRRYQPRPYVFYPAGIGDDADLLTAQILVRRHSQKKTYVAKTLIRSRLERFKPTIDVQPLIFRKLMRAATVADVRQIEAQTTARYWQAWFDALGVEESRREDGPLKAALDAGSKFLYGIVLRWVLFHKLSPCHGFLHEPTSYPSLAYDLMEPYRYMIEDSVAAAFRAVGASGDEKQLVAASINELKKALDTVVYVPATRQYVRRKNLLHGVVLALRAYLLNEQYRLVLPTEGVRKGGRPPKIGYRLPGTTREDKRERNEEKRREGSC